MALSSLDRKSLPHWPADLLPRAFVKSASDVRDSRDRALAEQIEIGVVKNLLLLQHLLQHYSGRALKSIDPLVQKIIVIGLYQLRFLQRIPDSAAVNEAVEQAKRLGLGRASGFVNAVLRKAVREPQPPLPAAQPDPHRYTEVVLSHPPELFDRLASLLGWERAIEICGHDNCEPPTLMRLAPGVSPEHLAGSGVVVRPHKQNGIVVVEGAKQALLAEWAQRRLAQVQDPTAARVVEQLGVRLGDVVMDRCSGMGTKTIQMREMAGDEGLVVAIDPSAARCEALLRTVKQREYTNVRVRQIGMIGDLSTDDPRLYDRILIDVPCSNSGVMARRAEARYVQTSQQLVSLQKLQDRILNDTAQCLKPGGRLVYSTCSIWPDENQQRINVFLGRHPSFELLDQQSTLPESDDDPGNYHDGGYFALLTRR